MIKTCFSKWFIISSLISDSNTLHKLTVKLIHRKIHRNSSALTQGVIRSWWFSPSLVHILRAWSSPVRSTRVDQVGAEIRALRRTSRVGPWADTVPAIHGGLYIVL